MQALHEKKEELQKLDTKVIIVSFVADEEAKSWRNEVLRIVIKSFLKVGILESEYPLLVDPECSVYHNYGLFKNAENVWSLKVRAWYWLQRLKGKTLHQIHGDPDQLGGELKSIYQIFRRLHS